VVTIVNIVPPPDASSVIRWMCAETDWRNVVGYALAYLHRKWPGLDNRIRDHELSRSAAELLLADFETLPEFVKTLADWMRNQPEDDETIFDVLLAFDQALGRLGESNLVANLDGATVDGVQMWRGRRGILTALAPDEDASPASQQNEEFSATLSSRLTWLRFVPTVDGVELARLAKDLDADAAIRFAARFEHGSLIEPLRVGLFSLRGNFMPAVCYTETKLDWYGFRVGEIAADDYEATVREIVLAASDPDRGAHILVFPEFMLAERGRRALRAALTEAARTPPLQPPILTFAGSCHQRFGVEMDKTGNTCEVYCDGAGPAVWEQWKRERYGNRWAMSTARTLITGLPADIEGKAVSVREDIEPNGPTKIIRTPLGTMAIAICSDLMPQTPASPASYLAGLPVDWLIVPAFSDRTEPFSERAYEFSRNLTATFFVNAWPAVEMAESEKKARLEENDEDPLPPAQRKPDPHERVLAAFLSTPWTGRPIEFWKDKTGQYRSDDPSFWVGIGQNGNVDGLIVDLSRLLGLLDEHLTN
jgi:hypothetical protein